MKRLLLLLPLCIAMQSCGGPPNEKEAAKDRLKAAGIAFTGNAFIERIEMGDKNSVRDFLIGGMDPNTDTGYATVLFLAARSGNLEITRLLLDHGANVNPKLASNYASVSPLQTAVAKGDPALVQYMIEKGADVNAPGSTLGGPPIFTAVERGLPAILKMLLKAGAQVNAATENGQTALDAASQNNSQFASPAARQEILQILLEAGAKSGKELTPAICLAVKNQDMQKIQELIRQGASLAEKDALGQSALLLAVQSGPTDFILSLLSLSNDAVNVTDNQGVSPLLVAVQKANLEVVKALIAAKADVNHVSDRPGETVLTCAVTARKDLEMLKTLIQAGANVNLPNRGGRTALMLASTSEDIEPLKLLIASGADLNAKTREGYTALSMAKWGKRTENEDYLRVSGAKD